MVLKKKKKSAPAKSVAKKAPVKKAPAHSVVKKSAVKKVGAKPVAKSIAKKSAATRAPAKKAATRPTATKKAPGRPFPAKASVPEAPVATPVSTVPAPVIEERRLVMPPPPRPTKNGKKSPPLKPIKSAPLPVVVAENETPWSAAELKAVRAALAKELVRLNTELASVELEMDALIRESGEGAGDDQADAGTKTFEREHEMSLVINARDMVLQTERALERIDNRTYGRCEECGNPIGKARLQVFPRATLCMTCKQKEERR